MGDGSNTWKFLLLGIVLICCFFVVIEAYSPYAFLKDDNIRQFLPPVLVGMEQLFSGNLPSVNMHQLAGSPLLESGTYAVLYPVMHLSYFIAHHMLGNDFFLFEVYAFIHILLGFVAMFYLLRKLKLNDIICMLGGVGFALSGYFVIAVKAWYYVAPTALFLPLIFLLHLNLLENPSKRNTWLLGLSRGLYFYTGNIQYFIYTCFFELLFVMISKKRQLPQYFVSLGITLALALPQLIVQFLWSSETTRATLTSTVLLYLTGMPANPIDFVFGNVLPYPAYSAASSFSAAGPSFSNIYFTGALFFLVCLYFGFKVVRKHKLKAFRKYPFLSLAIIAAVLSFGIYGLVHVPMIILPFWNALTKPFKLTLYSNFFIVIFGAQALSSIAKGQGKKFFALLTIAFLVLMLVHVRYSAVTDIVPFDETLPLNTGLLQGFDDGRALTYFTGSSHSPLQKTDQASSLFMHNNYASLYGIYSILGYESVRTMQQVEIIPLGSVNGRRMHKDWLDAWGIRYYFVATDSLMHHPELQDYKPVQAFGDVIVLENTEAPPIVSCRNYELSSGRVEFNYDSEQDRECVISVLYDENYKLLIDGKKVEFSEDEFSRIKFTAPAGKHKGELSYSNCKFKLGAIAGLVLLIIIFLFHDVFFLLASWIVSWKIWKKWIWIVIIVLVLLLLKFLFALNQEIPLQMPLDCALSEPGNMKMCVKGMLEAQGLTENINIEMKYLDQISEVIPDG
ncbi:hypothetical protein ACFL1B_02540 [Nanoarchaeota archaeon]